MPCVPFLREPDSKYQAWGVEGAPFVKCHYRSAALDGQARKRVTQERIWHYIREFQTQIAADDTDAPSSSGAIAKVIPYEVSDMLKMAFAKRDKQMLLQSIEKYVQQGDPNEEFQTRIAVLKELISKSIGPEAGAEGAKFLFEAVRPMLPGSLREIAQQTLTNISAAETGKRPPTAGVKEVITDSIIPGALTLGQMDECALDVVQARSNEDEWTGKNGVMGIHPGCLFGCHCAATWEFGGPKYAMGYMPEGYEQALMPEHLDFDDRYPRRPSFWYDSNIQEQDKVDW